MNRFNWILPGISWFSIQIVSALSFISLCTPGANHKTLALLIIKSVLRGAKIKFTFFDEYFVGQEDEPLKLLFHKLFFLV